MGSLTFTLVGDASVGTLTKSYTIADVDVNRFVAFAKSWYGKTATPQAMLAWADDVVGITKERVIATEQREAAAAATQPFPTS